MKTRYHFSRQRRQLRHLGKQLLRLRSAGQTIPRELQMRFQRLAQKLNSRLGSVALRRALGAAAILVSFGTMAQAQTDPVFLPAVENPFGLTGSNAERYTSSPAFADIDGDGDLDLFFSRYVENGNEYDNDIIFRENTGTAEAPAFGPEQVNPFSLDIDMADEVYQTQFVDIDQDGDLDLFVSNFYYINEEESIGSILYLENVGTASSPEFTTAVENPLGLDDDGFDEENLLLTAFGDLDGDGDLDILITNYDGDVYGNGFNVFYFENESVDGQPVFGAAQVNPFNIDPQSNLLNQINYSQFVDLDLDGDLDLVGSGSGFDYNTYDYSSIFSFIENVGTTSEPDFAPPVFNQFGIDEMVGQEIGIFFGTAADLDSDGDLDYAAFTGDDETLLYYQNGVISSSREFAAQLDLSMAPNPTNGLVRITTSEEIARIEVSNLMGQKLRTWSGNQSTLDLGEQPAGIYLVKILTKDDRFQVIRLRKQ